ncbi:GNAT family N-acetyltransferase [Streptomyces bambusae]|uniref:GNAT family N-acetyltransferase n=1 Tax=Streptomyces bambusae TaxID=1550616 RepID=UPI001CFE9EE1|nr:GNAT family N-acetyltransferase [Streptomyces bambusae]MCB5166242.1 GNAT family N-acetyltransferase [Streptomyces bambusae]
MIEQQTQCVVRAVRADEWERVRDLRIEALKDPAAPVAFLETLAQAEGREDSFWQDRAAGASHGTSVRQFIAEDADGTWVGSVTLLVERAGDQDFFEGKIEGDQGHLVGVYVRPEHRGTGVIEALCEAALEWGFGLEEPVLERVRLFVHEDNGRAQAFYQRFGFEFAGNAVPFPEGDGAMELELAIARPA